MSEDFISVEVRQKYADQEFQQNVQSTLMDYFEPPVSLAQIHMEEAGANPLRIEDTQLDQPQSPENDRTLYGGYRVNLAKEAKDMAKSMGSDLLYQRNRDITSTKTTQQRTWEAIFGKHSATYSPKSIYILFKKEGKSVFFLITLGMSASILDYSMNLAILGLKNLKQLILIQLNLGNDYHMHLVLFCTFTVVLSAISVQWTLCIDPVAAGSGIPEMKVIISGDLRRKPDLFLNAKTLLSKCVGLVFAVGGGLSIGREGPFVHTACIICHQLLKHIKCFKSLKENKQLHRHFYSAACAVGVASTFGAPIGGVLFSIEVTSTYFLITNYWRGLVAAVSGAAVKQLMDLIRNDKILFFQPLFPTNFRDHSFVYSELLAFALLGFILGLVGPAYIRSSRYAKDVFYNLNHKYPILWAVCIAFIISLLLFLPGEYSRLEFKEIILDLCSADSLQIKWQVNSTILTLFLSFAIRFLVTVLSTSIPVPAGDFIPMFVTGAAFGRLLGETMILIFPDNSIVPGSYALVGGACLVASTTHTFSVAVIALEFTGQFIYMTPILLSVLISGALSRGLSHSIYDSTLIQKGLPYLPMLRFNQVASIKGKDIMIKELFFLSNKTTFKEIFALLKSTTLNCIPVVENQDNMLLIGSIQRKDLSVMLKDFTAAHNICIKPNKIDCQSKLRDSSRIIELPTGNLISCTSPLSIGDADEKLLLSSVTLEKYVKPVSIVVGEMISVEHIHILFEMMKYSKLFVCKDGTLVGVISRRSLYFKLQYINEVAGTIRKNDDDVE